MPEAPAVEPPEAWSAPAWPPERSLEEVLVAAMAEQAPNRDQSRAEFVYAVLGGAIRGSRFTAGQRVREEEIAQVLGVSRTPVREALRRLQSEGLLEVTPGRGLGVATMSRQQVLELYEMREVLEGAAARLAAKHASPGEVALLHDLMREGSAAGDDAERVAAVNRTFHHAIYDAAHNRYLMGTLRVVYDSMALLGATTFTVPGRSPLANAEHRVIVEAIDRRDATDAEQAMRHHIENAKAVRLKMLATRGDR